MDVCEVVGYHEGDIVIAAEMGADVGEGRNFISVDGAAGCDGIHFEDSDETVKEKIAESKEDEDAGNESAPVVVLGFAAHAPEETIGKQVKVNHFNKY